MAVTRASGPFFARPGVGLRPNQYQPHYAAGRGGWGKADRPRLLRRQDRLDAGGPEGAGGQVRGAPPDRVLELRSPGPPVQSHPGGDEIRDAAPEVQAEPGGQGKAAGEPGRSGLLFSGRAGGTDQDAPDYIREADPLLPGAAEEVRAEAGVRGDAHGGPGAATGQASRYGNCGRQGDRAAADRKSVV